MTLDELCAILRLGRFDLGAEKACQAEMQEWLERHLPAGSTLRREPMLGPDRRDIPDFLVDGRLAIEVKMNAAQPRAVRRQLERYVRLPQVEGLILATNRAILLPETLLGKPVRCVSLGEAWL